MPAKGQAMTPSTKAPQQDSYVEKVKPKRGLSSYLCFTTANVKSIAEKENISYPEAIKKAAATWNGLDDKAKEPYVKMQADDLNRFNKEMNQFNETGFFTNKEGVCSSTLKAKVKRSKAEGGMVSVAQPVLPKRASHPYLFLIKTQAKSVMEKNECTMVQASSLLSKQWNEMTEAQK